MSQINFGKIDIEKNIKIKEIEVVLENKRTSLVMKRLFDICVSIIGLVFLFPLLFVISIIIKLDSEGSILFRQTRIGKNGEMFKILKFRTMVIDAENKGMQITVGQDNRITKSGGFLRKSKMDELPQLINVLVGDMSFVGPRPEVPKYVALYDENQKKILSVRPGITDLASIRYRNESEILGESKNPEKTYIEEIMPKKIELNAEYIRNISIVYDIKLICTTIFTVLK